MTEPRNITADPAPFDEEERATMAALDDAIDSGLTPQALAPERRSELEAAARATMSPPKTQITTRLAQRDLARLKTRALELGMPYQTLLASIVHQYVEGRLTEKK